ncbi:Flocculation protein FLO9, partial [Nakaseomyces glabratus]
THFWNKENPDKMLSNFFICLLLIIQCASAYNFENIFLEKRDFSSNAPNYPVGCSPSVGTQLTPGLSLEVYAYPMDGNNGYCWNATYKDPEFPRSGYLKNKLLGKADGVVGPLNFLAKNKDCSPKVDTLPAGFNFPQPITVTNFTMVLFGYLAPKQSGKYTFKLLADDLLLLNLGATNAFDCCNREATKNNLGEFLAYNLWPNQDKNVTVYLEKGVYYPLRLFFNNRDGGSQLDFSYYFNDSPAPLTDFSGMFFSVPDGAECPARIGYQLNCRSINSTTTYSTQYVTTALGANELPVTSTIYYVATPCADQANNPVCKEGFYDPVNKKCYIPPEDDYTTTIDKGNGEYETDLISHITKTDQNGKPTTTVRTTIKLYGPAPPPVTKTIDLGNEVTEYLVISYWTTTNEVGSVITTEATKTYSPPPVTITATTAADYVETDWISFFITTNDKGEIITDSTLFNATRDYNLPEAPHTSFGPAPPAETKTVDLGNEVTEYLVISYWTTTNEFGGLITTSSTRTYSPPPVTITATTAADYVETDWISFFITTNDKGEIITDSTLFNATRDYNLPEAPHTSFGPAPPAETKTVDLGNEVTEYLVISYWTTTNEFGGLITTSSTRTYSPPPVTITATTAADYVETDWISFFITTNDKGEIITDSTLFNATRDYNLPEAPHTSFGPAPPAETKTVDLGNEVTEYLVISYWTTTNEFGGLITTSSTRTYSPPPVTITATTAADYVETDWISFFITTNDKGEIITDSTLFNATRDYNLPEAPHTSFGPAPPAETKTVDLGNEVTEYLVISYWTTTNEFGGLITTSSTRTYSPPPVTITATTAADYVETDWISFFITTNDKGEIITDSTLFNATRDYNLPEAPHTSFGPAPPAETKTVDLGNEVTEYLVISYWTTTNEFGGLITTSSTRTYSPPPVTITATTAADYVETDWISFFITTNDKGEIITDSTLFNATRDYNLPEAPHTSFGPAPPAETKTVDLGNEVTEYLVISYWTTTNEFGGLITTSSTRTYSPPPVTITATTAADYVETDWISFFITTNDKGEIITDSTLFNATREYIDAQAPHLSSSMEVVPPEGEADYTTTIDKGNGEFETDLVSHITTKDSDGKPTTITTTIPLKPSDAGEADYTTTIDKGNGEFETDLVSHITTKDSDGKPTTITTTIPLKPSDAGEADYTTTIDKGNGEFETDLVSHITTKDSDGKPTTITTTIPLKPSDAGEADYTTTIDKGNGEFETDLVSHITTKDSDGKPTTITTTIPLKPSDAGEADYTTTIDKGNGEFETDLVSHITTKDSDGKPTTITTTIPLKPSDAGEADYTTTIDKGNGEFETDLVSHITTKDSDGKPTTITTTIPLKPSDAGEADYTTTIDKGNGEFETDLVSHITTKDSDGKPTTITTTIPLKPSDAGEADYTTTIDKGNGEFETDLVSHITTKDSDGKPTTITTTIPLKPSDAGEADYTTTIDKGNGEFETDLVSHITTKDSDGKPTTITTTIPLKPSDAGEADYTTTIDKGNGEFETDLVSHITTKDSDGKPTTITTTIPLKPSDAGEADYTTLIDNKNSLFSTQSLKSSLTYSYSVPQSENSSKISTGKVSKISSNMLPTPGNIDGTTTELNSSVKSTALQINSDSKRNSDTTQPVSLLSTSLKDSEAVETAPTSSISASSRVITSTENAISSSSFATPVSSNDSVYIQSKVIPTPSFTINVAEGSAPKVAITLRNGGLPIFGLVLIFYGKKDSSENGYAHGCSPSIRAKLKPGLSMEIYSYALRPTDDHCWDSAYLDPMFPRTGYLTHKLLGKAEGIIGPLNFLAKNPACIPAVSTLPLAFHFPKPFTITNFTMLLYGYLSPKKTGKYTFKLLADDLLLMNFGADNAFDCCSHDATKDNIGEYVAYSVWPGVNKNVTVYLESGIYYPLRLFFNNRDAIAQLDFAYYFNDSPIRQTDFSGMFFSIPDSVKCPANIGYKFECRSIKSTTTYSTKYITTKSAKNEIAFTSTIYYVATPCAVQPNPPLCGKGFYDPINNKCFTPEPDYITTIDKGNGEFETDLISHITQKDSNGTPTNTITTTIHLTPTYDYTKTVTSDGHTITEVVSHITTTDSDGEGVVYATTRMFYAEAGEAVHTSAWPYSQPSVVTRTVSESDGVVDTVVISYFPSVGEDGVTRTVTSTVRTITADYTTTVTSDGHTITEVVSHITTTDSDGEGVVYATTRMFYAEAGEAVHTSAWPYSQPSVVTRTVSESDGVVDTVVISYFPSVGEDGVTRTVTSTVRTITADYTTTVTSDGHTITEVVSHITTTDSDGEGVVYATTRMFYAEAGEAVHTSAWPYSQPSVVTRTVSESDGVVDTVVISYFPSVGEDGVTRTVTSTVRTITADYTTTVTSDGHTITEVVSHITTTDSDGEGVVYATTRMFYAEAGEAVHTSAWPYSQPSVVTRTVSESDGVVDTVVISYFPSVGEDGVTRTVTSTVRTITADYTTTVTSDGHTITEVVSHITTTDSDGQCVVSPKTIILTPKLAPIVRTRYFNSSIRTSTSSTRYSSALNSDNKPTKITTTVPVKSNDLGEADFTKIITTDGHIVTEVILHITATNSLGKVVTYVTTAASYDQVDEGVFRSPSLSSQPPVSKSTFAEDDGSSKSTVISYLPFNISESGENLCVSSSTKLYANKSLSDFSVSVSLRVSKTISSGTKSRIPSKGTGDSISTAVLPSNIALTPSLSVNIAVSDGGTTHFSFHVGTMLIVACMLLAIAAE